MRSKCVIAQRVHVASAFRRTRTRARTYVLTHLFVTKSIFNWLIRRQAEKDGRERRWLHSSTGSFLPEQTKKYRFTLLLDSFVNETLSVSLSTARLFQFHLVPLSIDHCESLSFSLRSTIDSSQRNSPSSQPKKLMLSQPKQQQVTQGPKSWARRPLATSLKSQASSLKPQARAPKLSSSFTIEGSPNLPSTSSPKPSSPQAPKPPSPPSPTFHF